jgi:glyoxylase-like metal-dependent hydrolase (beta-lactamase superfamily II)
MATPAIRTFPLGGFQTNCHVVWVPGDGGASAGRECWIVDPGESPRAALEFVRAQGLVPSRILLTHAHADHIAGLDAASAAFPQARVLLHRAEHAFLEDPQLNLSAFIGLPITARPADGELRDGEELELAGTRWRVLHTPGHSPGSVTLACDAAGEAIVGDTLFAGSIGRVDFPTSDPAAMHRSLHEVLMRLPDAMRVHPGHGPSTTVGAERRSNPWLQDDGWAEEA